MSLALPDAAAVIIYRKNWRRSLPRLLLGLPASVFASALPYAVLLLVLHRSLYYSAAIGLPVEAVSTTAIVKSDLFPVSWGLIYVWVYLMLVFRPAMDKQTGRQLSKWLHAKESSREPRCVGAGGPAVT